MTSQSPAFTLSQYLFFPGVCGCQSSAVDCALKAVPAAFGAHSMPIGTFLPALPASTPNRGPCVPKVWSVLPFHESKLLPVLTLITELPFIVWETVTIFLEFRDFVWPATVFTPFKRQPFANSALFPGNILRCFWPSVDSKRVKLLGFNWLTSVFYYIILGDWFKRISFTLH